MVGRKANFSLETHQHTYFHLSPVAATLCGILQFLPLGLGLQKLYVQNPALVHTWSSHCQLWSGLTE